MLFSLDFVHHFFPYLLCCTLSDRAENYYYEFLFFIYYFISSVYEHIHTHMSCKNCTSRHTHTTQYMQALHTYTLDAFLGDMRCFIAYTIQHWLDRLFVHVKHRNNLYLYKIWNIRHGIRHIFSQQNKIVLEIFFFVIHNTNAHTKTAIDFKRK